MIKTESSVSQRAQSAKGKSAEKSPLEEIGSTLTTDAGRLNELILQQGDLVRKLKSEKASKVSNYILYLLIIPMITVGVKHCDVFLS